MATNILYVGDRNPSLTATLTDGSGVAINLTGFTVQFALRQAYATSNLFKSSATVVTPAAGTVRYDFAANDLATAPVGVYNGEWIATDGSSRAEHISAGAFEVRKGF